jgi:hypothetical protein
MCLFEMKLSLNVSVAYAYHDSITLAWLYLTLSSQRHKAHLSDVARIRPADLIHVALHIMGHHQEDEDTMERSTFPVSGHQVFWCSQMVTFPCADGQEQMTPIWKTW